MQRKLWQLQRKCRATHSSPSRDMGVLEELTKALAHFDETIAMRIFKRATQNKLRSVIACARTQQPCIRCRPAPRPRPVGRKHKRYYVTVLRQLGRSIEGFKHCREILGSKARQHHLHTMMSKRMEPKATGNKWVRNGFSRNNNRVSRFLQLLHKFQNNTRLARPL